MKEQVLHFFSAGVGGPFAYTGQDMITAHAKMVISEVAFHALSYHLLSQLEAFGAGTKAEREECLSILKSLKGDVQARGVFPAPAPSQYDLVAHSHRFLSETVPNYLTQLPLPKTYKEVQSLSLNQLYSLLPILVIFALPFVIMQLFRKVGQSHDLENNNSGLFQFAQTFYSGGIVSAVSNAKDKNCKPSTKLN